MDKSGGLIIKTDNNPESVSDFGGLKYINKGGVGKHGNDGGHKSAAEKKYFGWRLSNLFESRNDKRDNNGQNCSKAENTAFTQGSEVIVVGG